MKVDKRQGFNDYLDNLSKGNMKQVWDYFNTYQRKRKKNNIQLNEEMNETF